VAAAYAAPVSFGAVYLIALLATRLGLPVQICCLLSIGVLLSGWAVAEWSRRPQQLVAGAGLVVTLRRRWRAAFEGRVGAGLLVAAMILGLALWSGLHSALTVPAGWDAMHHGFFVRQIVDHHTLSPAVVLSSDAATADGTAGFYPLAFNLVTALLHQVSGLPISVLMLASTTALAGVLLPLASYFLVQFLIDAPETAGFAAVASTLPINLYTIEDTGRITAVLGLALVPAACGLLLCLGRQLNTGFWVIGGLVVIGVTGMHTSETPLLFAVVGVLALVLTAYTQAWGRLVRCAGCLLGAAVAAALLLVVIEPGLLHVVGERSASLGPDGGHQSWGAALRALIRQPQFGNGGMLAFTCTAMAGVLLTVLPRWGRLRGAALCYLGFCVFYLTWVTGALGPFAFLGLPWYRDPARMIWVLSLLGAIPVGVSLAALTALAQWLIITLAAAIGRRRQVGTRGALAAAGALLLVLTLWFGTPAVTQESVALLKGASPVDPDYQVAFQYLASHRQPGSRVLDDLRNHGDLWMFIDDDVPTLLGNAPLIGLAPDSWKERLYLRGNLATLGTDPCIGQLLKTYHVSYVFFGDQVVAGGSPLISLATLQNEKYFREDFRQGGAHVFQIIPPASAGLCTTDLTTQYPWSTIGNSK